MRLSAMPSRSEWLWQLSSQDALTCHTWLPFSSVQNNDQIQRKGKERNKNHTHAALSGLFCFHLVKGSALHDGRLLKFFLNSGGTAAEEPIIRRNNNIFCLCLPPSFVWRFLPKGSSLIEHSSCVARENDQRIIYMSRTDLVFLFSSSFHSLLTSSFPTHFTPFFFLSLPTHMLPHPHFLCHFSLLKTHQPRLPTRTPTSTFPLFLSSPAFSPFNLQRWLILGIFIVRPGNLNNKPRGMELPFSKLYYLSSRERWTVVVHHMHRGWPCPGEISGQR